MQGTSISWTDNTHNPWQGCHHVSEECENCFMYTDKLRYGQDPTVVVRSAPATFNAPRRWERQMAAGTYPSKHHGDRLLVFTCSWSDFFIKEADGWRDEVWSMMRETPHLIYQILTKRPGRIAAHLPADWGTGYPNVWLGVSVGTPRALRRLDILATIPAAVHFASFEPLLGDLGDLTPWLSMLGWAIVGGESGPGWRNMEIAWLERVVRQCVAAGVPVWVKQDSCFRNEEQGRLSEAMWALKQHPPIPPVPLLVVPQLALL